MVTKVTLNRVPALHGCVGIAITVQVRYIVDRIQTTETNATINHLYVEKRQYILFSGANRRSKTAEGPRGTNAHLYTLTTQPSKQSINISFQAPGQKE